MSSNEIVLLVLDAVVGIMFGFMLRNSAKVEVESLVGNRYVVFVLFVLLAIVGFFHNEGIFRFIQSGIVILLGLMYLNMKSGLSPEGVVLMGSLAKYKKIKSITLSKNDSSLFFEHMKKTNALFFRPEQYDDFRNYLARKSISVKKMPK